MKTLTSKLTVELEGRGKVTIGPNDFVTCGGEASIYRVNNDIIKIYLDDAKMVADGMPDKIRLLSQINKPSIVAPQGAVLAKNQPVGLYMEFCEGEPLPRVFTTAFWTRMSFTTDCANVLVDRMRDAMSTAHQFHAIMVDPNEANWVVDVTKVNDPQPKVFDVDSWAIGRWPASVIVPAIRDYHSQTFDERSDWFSWAVISFQVYTGIHPYRGTLAGYGIQIQDLIERMKANLSVFAPGVRLNRTVRDFATIPGPLRAWYQATFQNGERTKPPSPFHKDGTVPNLVNTVRKVVSTASGTLRFVKLLDPAGDPIARTFACGVAQGKSGSLYDLGSMGRIGFLSDAGQIIKVKEGWLVADWKGQRPIFGLIENPSYTHIPIDIEMDAFGFLVVQDRLFLQTYDTLVELSYMNLGKPLLSPKRSISTFGHKAVQLFDGLLVQEALGAKSLVLPYGTVESVTVRVPQLDGLKVMDAKAGPRFVSVIGLNRSGEYVKLELTFNQDYSKYTYWQGITEQAALNAAVLPKMVLATIISDGELVVYVPVNGNMSKLKDKNITTEMQLSNWGDKVIYIHNGAVWQVSVSPN